MLLPLELCLVVDSSLRLAGTVLVKFDIQMFVNTLGTCLRERRDFLS